MNQHSIFASNFIRQVTASDSENVKRLSYVGIYIVKRLGEMGFQLDRVNTVVHSQLLT